MAQENYDLAAGLFALAGIYASFDEDRITDKTIENARVILITNTFSTMSQDKKTKFSQAFDQLIKDPERLEKLCNEIQRIGAPNYYPSYMIFHGIKTFTGNPYEDAIVKDFDASGVWNNLQSEYLHCPN